MDYSFFSYKYNISEFQSALYSPEHIAYIVLAFVSVILLGIFLRKADHKKFRIFLLVVAIVLAVLEIVKISWESYWDITTGRGFNVEILPLYSCSLFTYTAFFAVFGKGKVREIALAWIGTIGLVCGMIGVVYTNTLNFYPFWTFGAFHSLIYHYTMFLVGVLVLTTGVKKLEWKDIVYSWIPILILSIIVSPINYYYGADYMQIYSAGGVPVMSTLADVLDGYHLRPIFTMIMILAYIPISAAVVGVVKLVMFIYNKTNKKDKSIKLNLAQSEEKTS